MDVATTKPDGPIALKLGSRPDQAPGQSPVVVPPVPAPSQPADKSAGGRDMRKDGFLAAAALGGMLAALSMMIIAPSCVFLVGKVKELLSREKTPIIQPVEPAREVVWPEVTLSGILAPKGKHGGSAILNGQLIGLRQQILNVRVVDLHDQEVVVECDGARKTLRVGDTTL